jgi:hypothetical protein
MRSVCGFLAVMVLLAPVAAQEPEAEPRLQPREARPAEVETITVPAGTRLPLVLKHGISTRNARPGDGIYAETSFPVVVDGEIVIPPGSYVQGTITSIQRAGRVKGRAELQVAFRTIILPNGYTVSLPGSVESAPGGEGRVMKDEEGTMQAEGERGKDATKIATTTGTGAAIGAIAGRGSGAAMGAGIGGAVGLATVLLSRGSDLRLEAGSTLEVVLQRPMVLEAERLRAAQRR